MYKFVQYINEQFIYLYRELNGTINVNHRVSLPYNNINLKQICVQSVHINICVMDGSYSTEKYLHCIIDNG